jgi:hypothetical protein
MRRDDEDSPVGAYWYAGIVKTTVGQLGGRCVAALCWPVAGPSSFSPLASVLCNVAARVHKLVEIQRDAALPLRVKPNGAMGY